MAKRLRMEAEIVTEDPGPIVAELTRLGRYELEVIHWPEPLYGATVVATTFTSLDEFAFFYYMSKVVARADPDPDAFVNEAGIVWQPSPVNAPGVVKRRFPTGF